MAEAGFDPDELEGVLPRLTTMETAWLVSGLLHAAVPALRPATIAALRELESRLDRQTLVFHHASPAAPAGHRLRRCIANFADQIYPLQALAFAAIALGDAERGQLADRCAAKLVAGQGPLGQWWWHHDARTGRVAERYPVYSVHQHSMAPMALRALALSGGSNHDVAVNRSRAWLQANELCIEMLEPDSGIIWRSIEREEGSLAQRLRQARILAGLPGTESAPPHFRLNREIRPYEWGWLLYASSIESKAAPAGHVV
jgi:hypothetical protein